MQRDTSPSHRLDCGLWNVVPLLFNGCAKFLDISINWKTLSYTSIQSIPNMFQWATYFVSMQAMEELGHFQLPGFVFTDPCNMGPCIIMLKHEVMVADEWHDNGPQDFGTVSLCIQIDIDKMQLCLLSIAYVCAYHNPTMGHSVHNVDISKLLTHTMPYTLSAI